MIYLISYMKSFVGEKFMVVEYSLWQTCWLFVSMITDTMLEYFYTNL